MQPPKAFRNSWTGGTLAGLKLPSESHLDTASFFPGVWSYVTPDGVPQQTAYPSAVRESWSCAVTLNGTLNKLSVPHTGELNIAYGDTHAKFLTVDSFLSKCPTKAQYGNSSTPGNPTGRTDCNGHRLSQRNEVDNRLCAQLDAILAALGPRVMSRN